MSTRADDDDQQRFALGFLFALIALVLLTVVGVVIYKYGMTRMPQTPALAPAPVAASATEGAAMPDGASIRVVDGVVSFYFATGSADIAPGAADALALVIKGVESGRKAVVSGFHDTTGDPAKNEELAKKRAEAVRDVLISLAVPAARVDLRKPVVTTGSGNNAQARRVEVKLVD